VTLPFKLYLVVLAGSALGGLARYVVSGLVGAQFGETFPWGTVIVNVSGCFVIGFFAGLTAPDGRLFIGAATRQFVLTGLCGGYTTFSSFSLQTINLMNEGDWVRAGGNVAGSVVMCLFATWLGTLAAAAVNQLKGA
jgi:CrcB protein